MKRIVLLSFIFLSVFASAQNKKAPIIQKKTGAVISTKKTVPQVKQVIIANKERLVEISTDYGIMIARLYDSTPLHRDNFINLAKAGFYDSLLFHRVIKDFMIQGGDPNSRNATDTSFLGAGEAAGERIPAEFRPFIIHKRGALAAARDNNPGKASSNCQFYIVQGKKFDSAQLNQVYEQRIKPNIIGNFQYNKAQKEIYQRIGGTPHLDQNYTVFGEVISGLDVIDKIAASEIMPGDRPVKNVRMKIRLLN